MSIPFLVFTDLDGTLLDHHTYSWEAATATIALLKQQQIPIIANTSKTAAEITELYAAIPLDTPFIVENGAAVYLPKQNFPTPEPDWQDLGRYWRKVFSPARAHWIALIKQVNSDISEAMIPFHALSLQQLMQLTGLSAQQAKLAQQREFAEPVYWQGSDADKTAFIRAITSAQGQVLQGGRFLHVGAKTDKGSAMLWLQRQYAGNAPIPPCTIALGDSGNDIAMLEIADIAVLVRSPCHPPPTLTRTTNVMTTAATGPSGWAEALQHILHQQEFPHG